MCKYCIPFYYLVLSRLKSKIDRVSWIIIFIVPTFLLGLFFTDMSFYKYTLVFILANLVFYSLYEIGYMENDIQTTKKEKNPTIRINNSEYSYLNQNYSRIIKIKYIIVFILVLLLALIVEDIKRLELFIGVLIVSRLFFYLHNFFRSRLNILTFFVLAITKYVMILFLVIPSDKLILPIFMAIVIFPLLRTIEHASRNKYKLEAYSKVIGNHDLFRLKYYFFMVIISSIILYYFKIKSLFILIFLLIYFLFFRFFSYLMVKKNIYKRDTLKTRDLKNKYIHSIKKRG